MRWKLKVMESKLVKVKNEMMILSLRRENVLVFVVSFFEQG